MQIALSEKFSFSRATIRLDQTGPTLRLPRKEKKRAKAKILQAYRDIADYHNISAPKKAPILNYKTYELWH